jgi:hypothetical protein
MITTQSPVGGELHFSELTGLITRQLQKNNIETGRGYWAGIFIKNNYLSGRHRAIKRDASKPCSGTLGS